MDDLQENLNNLSINKKKSLGQFFTTNYTYILQNLKIPENVETIIESFAGNGDLLSFIDKNKYTIECYDIDSKHDFIIEKDTLLNPPDYNNKFILTNPPYLARNKSKSKILFDKYDVNDLYKCFIKELLTNKCLGGIIIIPLNFWSSIRLNDIELRKLFLNIYYIEQLNIFEEQVFNDTSYTVCSFQFKLKKNNVNNENNINITIYPCKTKINTKLNILNNYIIGGEIYKLSNSLNYKITRITSKNKSKLNTNILVKCIDDNIDNQICLSIIDNPEFYIDTTINQTARTYATLNIEPELSLNQQKELVIKFNNYLTNYRKKYKSLFLTNYRESKDIARKRISFTLVYSIIGHILDNI